MTFFVARKMVSHSFALDRSDNRVVFYQSTGTTTALISGMIKTRWRAGPPT